MTTTTTTRPIQVITGEMSPGARRLPRLERLGWGRCYVERPIVPFADEPWIFDNGAFRWFKAGLAFQVETFQDRLAKAVASGARPLFAVIPDIVTAGTTSLAFSEEWLDSGELESTWDWYLAVQDGMTVADVEPFLARDDVAGLFVGGSKEFKVTASEWAALAHRYGKRCHYGRSSGLTGLRAAMAADCDSCDSAAILWSDLKFFRYAQVWLEESGVEAAHELVEWVDAGVAEGKQAERGRRAARKAAA